MAVTEATAPLDLTAHFTRFLTGDPDRLHAAAHSHHPWPDVTADAHQQAWLDANDLLDDKWERILGEVVAEARSWIASRLALPDPATIAVAPTTHELLMRVWSCLPIPARVLTPDAEFHSATRQFARLEEDGLALVERVPATPLDSLTERLADAAARGGHDLVLASHVLFDSGAVLDPGPVVAAIPDDATFVVIDGYHGFMAVPTDLSAIAGRAFYLAGGYKYAMAGEGACLLHCPRAYGPRPRNTGWFAAFGALTGRAAGRVAYPADGNRFLGGTLEATAWYRFNAVQQLLDRLGVGVEVIHAHVAALQHRFLEGLEPTLLAGLELVPDRDAPDRGHFLTFRTGDAVRIHHALRGRRVITDFRGDRLRFGFGVYHRPEDIDDLLTRSTTLPLD